MIRSFVGTNSYLIKQSVSHLKSDFIDKNSGIAVEEIDCEDIELEDVINAGNSVSLFSDKKLIILKNIAQNKKLSEQIEQIFNSIQDINDLIIVENNPDKRSSYYKFLKNNSEFNEYGEQDEHQLVEWLLSEAGNLDAELSVENAKYLIARSGIKQQSLYNELTKLVAYDKKITKESINLLTPNKPQSSIFNLLDAAFDGKRDKVLKIYEEQKAQGSEPQSIFGMLVWQTKQIATVAAAGNLPVNEISNTTGMKPFSINKASGIYRKIGREGVDKLLNRLTIADKQIKSGSVLEPDEIIKNFLTTIS